MRPLSTGVRLGSRPNNLVPLSVQGGNKKDEEPPAKNPVDTFGLRVQETASGSAAQAGARQEGGFRGLG